MSILATPDSDSEGSAFLAAARRLRYALTQRDECVRPYRERYDRSQDDLRVMPDKRVKIAGEFLRAALKADHVYEEQIEQALEEYCELMGGGKESRY